MDNKIRVLIGTPCGGGSCSSAYMLSLLDTLTHCWKIKERIFIRNQLREGKKRGEINDGQLQTLAMLEAENLVEFDIGLYTLSNESLLSRGRNHIAAQAIRQGWDKLFFIDADSQWTFQDFCKVALSPHDLCAGAVPLKTLPIALNFLPFQKDDFYFKDNIRSVDSLERMRAGHNQAEVPVAYIGTAFMAISRKLLLKAAERAEEYQYPNPATGHLHTTWNMFATTPMHGKFMSEDWYFCEQARSMGYAVMMNADVIIRHVGTLTYGPEMRHIKSGPLPQPEVIV